ncbi:Cytochrome P450 OS=Streptomyces alboniger OX=132473 GN=CP975_06295 PE=3 SV=1 [Streptomyces alboniger]
MRLPDVELDCAEDELTWTESMSSRHLVELPSRFAPKPPQDVLLKPGHLPIPSQRNTWQVGTHQPEPSPAPGAKSAPRSAPLPAPQPTAAAPQPTAAAPQRPAPQRPAPTPEPARPQGAWRRFLRWWRGY